MLKLFLSSHNSKTLILTLWEHFADALVRLAAQKPRLGFKKRSCLHIRDLQKWRKNTDRFFNSLQIRAVFSKRWVPARVTCKENKWNVLLLLLLPFQQQSIRIEEAHTAGGRIPTHWTQICSVLFDIKGFVFHSSFVVHLLFNRLQISQTLWPRFGPRGRGSRQWFRIFTELSSSYRCALR